MAENADMAWGVRAMTAAVKIIKERFPNLTVEDTVELAGKLVNAILGARHAGVP